MGAFIASSGWRDQDEYARATSNMNVLYKYCEQIGVVKILEELELKLPFVSQVNDPLECLPFFYCPDDKGLIEARYLSVLNQRNLPHPANYKRTLDKLYETGEIQKELAESSLKFQREWNRKNCLLSVSKTARNTVMWAHYADKHKGAVIGIDFDIFFPETQKARGIWLDPVKYSEQRPTINILTDFKGSPEAYLKAIFTKSNEWRYEQEFRAVLAHGDTDFKKLEQQGLACFREFNGKKTWFLRLNPESIKEIIFGLFTEESLKLAIRKLVERPELQHVKLYQTEESETYTLNLIEVTNR
jgi:hypothetical protein